MSQEVAQDDCRQRKAAQGQDTRSVSSRRTGCRQQSAAQRFQSPSWIHFVAASALATGARSVPPEKFFGRSRQVRGLGWAASRNRFSLGTAAAPAQLPALFSHSDQALATAHAVALSEEKHSIPFPYIRRISMHLTHVQPNGAMTFWTAGVTHRESLYVQIDALGLAQFMPPVRSDADCLKSAMRDYCALEAEEARKDSKDKLPDKLVQSLKRPKKNGFQVLDIERREDDNDYCKSYGCRVDDKGQVSVTRGYADQRSLQKFYGEHKRLLTGGAVSAALANIAKDHLGGTMLKSGLYWIPEDNRRNWSDVSKAFAAAAVDGDTAVTELRYLMDEAGVNAIKDAIIDEVVAASAKLQDEVATGDLGTGALTTRQFAAAALHARVSKYEAILGEALTALHETVRVAEEAAASAIALQESDEVYAGVF